MARSRLESMRDQFVFPKLSGEGVFFLLCGVAMRTGVVWRDLACRVVGLGDVCLIDLSLLSIIYIDFIKLLKAG